MAAPKGNKFAIGNSGRSKAWETPEALQSDIDAYFKECDDNKRRIYNKKTEEEHEIDFPIPYTIEGLCLALDCSRDTLLNYEKKKGYEDFFDTIKRAKLKIQKQKVELGLLGLSTPSVTIFDLKNNHGYKDKQEREINHSFEVPPLPDKTKPTPPEE